MSFRYSMEEGGCRTESALLTWARSPVTGGASICWGECGHQPDWQGSKARRFVPGHAANTSPPQSWTIEAFPACAEHVCPLDLEAGREPDQTEQHRIEVWHRARGAAQRHVSFAARFVSLPHGSLGLG